MTERRLAIFGYGGMGRDILSTAMSMLGGQPYHQIVFVSDDPIPPVLGIAVISPDQLDPNDEVIVAIGTGSGRRRIVDRFALRYASLIAPNALIGPGVDIGEGAIVSPFSSITCSTMIGRHFLCNLHSHIAHDCVIGDFVTLAPRVTCNGNVHIGDGAYIGAGAVIRHGLPERPLIIGRNAMVGMGAIVIRDVPDGATVAGNPARIIDSRAER